MLAVGDYKVILFNMYGTKVKTKTATSIVEAKSKGEERIGKGKGKMKKICSYVVERRLFNSLD